MGRLDITKKKLLTEIETAIDNKEDVLIKHCNNGRTGVIVGKYEGDIDGWIAPRIDASLKIVDE